jgi:hypothetical protein
MTFEYSNLSDRSPGWFLRLARRLLPGVGLVEDEIKPYAAAWHERNLAALASADPLWVVPGDSLSQGVGASSIESPPFRLPDFIVCFTRCSTWSTRCPCPAPWAAHCAWRTGWPVSRAVPGLIGNSQPGEQGSRA